MLEADGIQYEIQNRKILSNTYIRAERGAVTGIIGSNGCGKSTLLNIIFGGKIAEYSSIRIDGEKLKKGLHPKRIQYLPQFPIFPKDLRLDTIFKLYELKFSDFAQYFHLMKIKERKKFGELSSGTQRLIEAYIFLKNDCEITLLDEPFSFLMPIHIERIKQLIEEEKEKKTIVLTDHLFAHVHSICNKIYLLKNGRTIPIQHVDELIQNGYLPESFETLDL